MNKDEYVKDYRQIRVFKVVGKFEKPPFNDIPIMPRTDYVLAFDMTDAMKEATHQYRQGDWKYYTVLFIENLGYPVGIHHFT